MHVTQNWPNLEKRPPFLQFSSKLSDFFLVKDLINRLLLPLFVSFWEHSFFARMRCLKNGWPFSAPSSVYFYHPQLFKKIFGESWNHLAFTKNNLRSFGEKWRNTSDICTRSKQIWTHRQKTLNDEYDFTWHIYSSLIATNLLKKY